MPRASEDFLGSIHALVGEEIRDMLTDVDPRQRREGVQLALKFLKDNNNNITVCSAMKHLRRWPTWSTVCPVRGSRSEVDDHDTRLGRHAPFC